MPVRPDWSRIDPMIWTGLLLGGLVFGLPLMEPVFAAVFPHLERPVYTQDSLAALLLAHVALVSASTGVAALIGIGIGLLVTRRSGRDFRGLAETLATMGQTVPPVAVLALAVPAIGFGVWPALIALTLYGLLPILQNTLAGIDSVPAEGRDAARGLGMSPAQILAWVELPLAAPILLAGVRTSTVINVGTAAIASTVGARTLGTPIILGLNGSNIAYVLQGALAVALLAVTLDLGFERLTEATLRWRRT